MQLRGAMNQFERMKIKERTTRGRRQKARDGFVHSVGKRFGYIYLGEAQGSKGELRIDAAEAETVRRIFDEYLRGKRLGQIRAGLNRDGVKSARGGLWSRPVIHQILINPMFMGQMRGPGGIPVKCPAIISEEIFARIQAQLVRSKAANVGRPTRQYLLTGRLWCAQCGRRLHHDSGGAARGHTTAAAISAEDLCARLRRSGRAAIPIETAVGRRLGPRSPTRRRSTV